MKAAALAAVTALAFAATACGGGGGYSYPQAKPGVTVSSTIRIVGVGDSLTAGEQSGGLYGLQGGMANPIAGSFFPIFPAPAAFTTIPPTQGNGFWAVMWSQANGGANPLNPAISPLPLLATPLLNMYAPSTLTGPLGGSPTAFMAPCTGANAVAYGASTASQALLNPQTTPFDLGVPGQTLHEALYQVAPLTTCAATITPSNPNVALATLINAESASFYPVLRSFGTGITQVQAAVSLHPQIATVWLGSNDLLKYALSGGQVPATDPNAFYADMVSLIKQLQASGAKVAVANLFDVLDASYFTSSAELSGLLTTLGVPAGPAFSYYLSLVPAGGYLTLSGFYKVLASVEALGPAGPPPVTLATADTIPGAFASAIQGYNNAYNAQIAAAVTATGATLVDVHAQFAALYTAGGYCFAPSACLTFLYGGGLTSLDGIHPSNTAYALIANWFIGAIDAGLAQQIPLLTTQQIQAVYATDPYAPK